MNSRFLTPNPQKGALLPIWRPTDCNSPPTYLPTQLQSPFLTCSCPLLVLLPLLLLMQLVKGMAHAVGVALALHNSSEEA